MIKPHNAPAHALQRERVAKASTNEATERFNSHITFTQQQPPMEPAAAIAVSVSFLPRYSVNVWNKLSGIAIEIIQN